MIRVKRLTYRQWLIVLHDLVVTAAALVATIIIRFEDAQLTARLVWLPTLLVGFVIFAAVVYFLLGLHEPKWRFTSLPELLRIIRASAVLAISLLVLDYILLSPNFYGTFFFGKITIALYFVIQTAFLSGTRIAYRYFREARTQRRARDANAIPTLILGRAADVEVPLRAIESGAISKIWPVGLLSPARSDQGVSVRGVPVLGGFDDLERVIALLRERKTISHPACPDAVGLRAQQRRRIDSDASATAGIGDQPVARRWTKPGRRCNWHRWRSKICCCGRA